MDEGALGVDEEHVRDPNLLHQTAVKRHTLVVGALEGQTLVLPVVTEVQSHGEVLSEGERGTSMVCKPLPLPLMLLSDYILFNCLNMNVNELFNADSY